MPREYKARDKKVNKMTRNGLVEQNAVTGEVENISNREQDYSLRKEQPNGRDSLDKSYRADNIGRQADRNEPLRKKQSTQNYRASEQTAEPEQNTQNGTGDISPSDGSVTETVNYNLLEDKNRYTDNTVKTENNIPENPAEATKQIERSHTSPAVTPPGKSDSDVTQKYPYEPSKPPPKTEITENRGRLKFTQDPPQQQSGAEHGQEQLGPHDTPVSSKTPQSDKLQFSRDTKAGQPRTAANNRKSKRKLQKGNKYQQRFTPEAAQVEKPSVLEYRQTEQTAQPNEQPEVVNNVTPETPVSLTVPLSPQSGKNGKLQFVKDSALNKSRKGKKPQKKGNKYQQRFTPEAAKTQPHTVTDNTVSQESRKTDNPSAVNGVPKPEKAEPQQDAKQLYKPETSQTDKKPVSNEIQPEKAEPQHDDKQLHKPETSQADKKPVSNETQPEKTQLRTDPKPSKLQEKNGKLKFDTDNPVKTGRKPPRKSKNKRLIDDKKADKKPLSDGEKPRTDKPEKEKPLSDRHGRQTEPRTSQRDKKNGSNETSKKADKSGKLKFTDDEKSAPSDNKLTQLQEKADKYNSKLEKARNKLPSKTSKKTVRSFENGKSKAKSRLKFEKEILPPGTRKSVPAPAALAKKGTDNLTHLGTGKLHQKVYEVEHENVGVEAGHRVEQAAESVYRGSKRVTRSAFNYVRNRPYRTVEKLEKKAVQTNIKYSYRKALSENPQLKSNVFSRFMQKRKIKQQYAKAARDAKRAKNTVKKTGDMTAKALKAVAGVIKSHPVVAVIIAIVLLLIFFIGSFVSSLGGLAGTGLPMIAASSYLADDVEIDTAELSYTEWETDLLMKIDKTEQDYPGYDEYRYQVDNIGHNPYELIAYLTASYQDFKYADIESVLRQIFNEQYTLSVIPSVETRYSEGEDGELVPYDWHVLTVSLTSRSFTDVVLPRMDDEQTAIYFLLMQTKGYRQYIDSPFDFNWLPYVSSYYGYRIHPTTGAKDYHKGIDIAVPIGTEIQAGHDGRVTFAGYSGDYGYVVVIEDSKGLVSKYAHCDSLLVSEGQDVKCGDVIAKSGNSGNSTGPHLHLEVIKDGQYLNPLYFAVINDAGLSSPVYGYAGAPMGDGSYAALIEEAEKYLGMPYRWGGSSPATSFDCSGFVSFVLNQSGAASVGRTTAQGLYNLSTPVTASNAQPGDLIFFHSTYSTSSTVTHVGIYVGGGYMIHAGNPIQYTSINTSYWQNHLYAFGRLN